MTKRKKIKEIKTARELLKIESRFKKEPAFVRNILIGSIIVFYSLFLYFYLMSTMDKSAEERIAITLASFSVIIMLILVVNKILSTRGNPLIVTEKGIAFDPDIAEFWEDIQEYGWESFKWWKKMYLSRKYGEGVTLLIYNKGLWQRNILNYSGYSILSRWAIFFTPEQIREAEIIFNQHGIKNNKDFAYVEATNKENGKKTNLNYVLILQILLGVVIPTSVIILLNTLGILAVNFYVLLVFFTVIDTALIILLTWQSKKRQNKIQRIK